MTGRGLCVAVIPWQPDSLPNYLMHFPSFPPEHADSLLVNHNYPTLNRWVTKLTTRSTGRPAEAESSNPR